MAEMHDGEANESSSSNGQVVESSSQKQQHHVTFDDHVGVTVFSSSWSSNQQATPEFRQLRLAQVGLTFRALGVLSVPLGLATMALDLCAYFASAELSVSFSGLWAGAAASTLNGLVVLRSGCQQPHVTLLWSKLTLAFGLAALLLHVVGLSLALVSLTVFAYAYRTDCSNATQWSSHSQWLPATRYGVFDSARSVLLLLLVTSDCCQLAACRAALSSLALVASDSP